MVDHISLFCLIISGIELSLLPGVMLITGRYMDKHLDDTLKISLGLNIVQRHMHYALLIHDMDDHYSKYRYQKFAGFDFITIARTVDIIICSLFITLAYLLFGLLCGYGLILILVSLIDFTLSSWIMELSL